MASSLDYLLSFRDPGVAPQARALVTFVEEISQSVGSGRGSNQAFQGLLDHCVEALRASKGSLMLVDPVDEQELYVEASKNVARERIATLRFKLGEGIAGHVLDTGDLICLADAAADPRYLPGSQGDGHVQILAAPIPFTDRPMGVVSIERRADAPKFNEGDISLLKVVAAVAGAVLQNLRLREDLEQRVINLATVQQVGNLLISTLDGEKLLQSLVTYVGEVLGGRSCVVYILEEKTGRFTALSAFGEKPEDPPVVFAGQGSVGRVAEKCVPLLIQNAESHSDFEPRFECFPEAKNLILAPLIAKSGLLGVILVTDRKSGQPFRESDLEMLGMFAGHAAAALDNVRLYEKLERAATTDDLTQLANRRSFQESLEKEVARADRYGHDLSLLMLDIDHFKKVNDDYGHSVGDQVLRALGGVLRTQLRNIDIPTRYGGEEFAIIMPHTPKPFAVNVAERLRVSVEGSNFFEDDRLRTVTVSIGVAAYPTDATDMDTLIGAADNALYEAKHGGRNRVAVA
jgi:diguanylate cyclase (GGDEF)-like protein